MVFLRELMTNVILVPTAEKVADPVSESLITCYWYIWD